MKKNGLFELFSIFFKIGLFTFGGGLAMLSVLSGEIVDKRKWIGELEFSDMVVVAESTPGPIIINAATYVGFKLRGVWGAIVATFGAALPSFIIITIFYYFFDALKDNLYIMAAFKGIRAAVVFLLVSAVIKMLKPMKKTAVTITVTILVFIVSALFSFSAIYYLLIGGTLGVLIFSIRAKKQKKAAIKAENEVYKEKTDNISEEKKTDNEEKE